MSNQNNALEAWKAKYGTSTAQKPDAVEQAVATPTLNPALETWKNKYTPQTIKQPETQIAAPASANAALPTTGERM